MIVRNGRQSLRHGVPGTELLGLFSDFGARIEPETRRAYLNDDVIDLALASAPSSFERASIAASFSGSISGRSSMHSPHAVRGLARAGGEG